MGGLIGPVWPVLLQGDFDRSAQSVSPAALLILGLLLGAAIIGGLINSAIQRARNPRPAGESRSSQPKQPAFQASGFRRVGHALGLSGEEIAFLESYGRKLNVSSPEYTLRNPQALEDFLREVYQDIETHSESQALADQRAALLFRVRERIDMARSAGKHVDSTLSLPVGTVLTCITADGDHYTSRIAASSPEGMACEVPLDGFGQELRFRRGTRMNTFFYLGNQNGFSFQTKVSGYTRVRGASAMVLRHSDRVTPLPVREHKRKSLSRPCDFTPVTVVVVKNGSKTGKKAVLGKRSLPGQIVDISAGGASIRSANPLEEGEYLKIDFMGRKERLSAIGRVVRLNRVKGAGGVMHVQFAKVSRQDLNRILSMVYGYGD